MTAQLAPRTNAADLLTRTTLQFAGSLSTASIALVIRALQRVPGVLLADMNAAGARAIVAHDAAVTGASLLAATLRAGVNAVIVADAPRRAAVVATTLPLKGLRARPVLACAAMGFVALTSINAFVPNSAQNHWLFAVILSAAWLLFLAGAITWKKC